MDEIRVLQLGNEDWNKKYKLPAGISLSYAESFLEAPKKSFDLVFLDRVPYEEEFGPLYKASKAYALYVTDKVKVRGRLEWLYECKKGQRITEEDIQEFMLQEARFYYPKPYGEKFKPKDIAIAQGFNGSVKWNGSYSVDVCGFFGKEFRQIVYWRYDLPIFKGQMLDLWLEYRKDPEVSISLSITEFAAGSISSVLNRWEFSEKDLDSIVQIESRDKNGRLSMSLRARGEGELKIIALHDRYSRGSHGYFLPGGERYVTSMREEIFCYFHPGDRKPPLNIFFSGYKTRQGFEGYYLMDSMGAPFLLVAEPRLEGGSFYMGAQEYEQMMVDVIRHYMAELGFSSDQVIMAGLSMGTYGALYYGCDIKPHAMILGKPLTSIGNVAANEKRNRPGGFPASLDVLRYLAGDTDEGAVQRLNDRFWSKFDAVDWGKSKFIVSYMMEDDYDSHAYDTLISHLDSEGVQVYGKGIRGRHNDNTAAIVNWFSSQYKKVLREDFLRRAEK